MSAIENTPRPAQPGTGRGRAESLRILVRLTLLELRRSPMPVILPLIAAMFWFDALRSGANLPAIWTQRASILPDHVLPDIGPIAAGVAAWVAGREQRRGMGDLAESTARPRWLRQLACWGGALGWTLLAYAACTIVIYVLAARAGAWGSVPIWPIVVTGVAVAAFCTTGIVAGAIFPSRFTAPLAALGTLFASVFVYQLAVAADSGWSLISPNNSVPPINWGVFHPVPADLSIVQTIFFAGLVVLLLGVLGVRGSLRGAQLRRTATAVTAAGLAACIAGLALAATATRGSYGYDVPLLHDAASNQPISYTPDCTQGAAIPVCVHPVFSADLPGASTAFAPLIDTVAGLPGAPSRITQIAFADLPPVAGSGDRADAAQFTARSTLTTSGGLPVLEFGFDDASTFSEPDTVAYLRSQAAQQVIGHIIAPNGHPGAAQQAVELALMQKAHASAGPSATAPDPSVAAAAERFAALDATQARAWLTAHLNQLHTGAVTLEEVP